MPRKIKNPASPATSTAPAAAPATGVGVDVVPGVPPVPITLWRTATIDGDLPDRLGSRLAAAVVTSYSQPGDIVVDGTTHTDLATACTGAGRAYHAWDRADTADITAGTAALLVVDYPAEPAVATTVLAAARLLRIGGCLILVEASDAAPADHRGLHAAASAVGLGYFQHIVAVTADVEGDQFVYYASDAELAAAAGPDGCGHIRIHRDLRVYLRGGDARG